MGACFARRTEAVVLRLESTHDRLAERVQVYDLEIQKTQTALSDPRRSHSERLASLRRQKVFAVFRERAQNRMVVLLQKICAVEELESTREEIEVYKQVSKLFRNSPSVEKVEAMCSRLDQLTDDLCEISQMLDLDVDVSADLDALEREALGEEGEALGEEREALGEESSGVSETLEFPLAPTDPLGLALPV